MLPNLQLLATGLVYLFVGGLAGMLCRFADWSIKQSEERRLLTTRQQLALWWRDRLGSNVKSIAVAVVMTGAIVEGSILKRIPIAGSLAGIVLAAPVGLAITYGSHYLFAWGKRQAEAKAGGPVNDD